MNDGGPQDLLSETIAAVQADPRITLLTQARVVDVGGYVGQYRTTVDLAGRERQEVEHGAIVVATGARQIEPTQYLYGEHPSVVTQRELEALLQEWGQGLPDTKQGPQSAIRNLQSIVMIQCVGSRDDEHPYCSRICCTEAVKNALAIKARNPETDVTILYRDVRTFGFKERAYREARRQGVVFLQYEKDDAPTVQTSRTRQDEPETSDPEPAPRLEVIVKDTILNETLTLYPDLVVLSAGIEPNEDNERLAQLFKVPLNEDGFFLEAHAKLRPLDFAADGLFLCGLAHSPRFLDETIAQAHGAAVHAVSLLARERLEATPITARVNPRLCAACGLCVEVCPYGARVIEPSASQAEVIEVLCQGCGACVVACPNKASRQRGFEPVQVLSMLDVLEVG